MTSSRTLNGSHEGPAVSQFVLPESERLVLSVENGPHALARQEFSRGREAPGSPNRQFHNRFVGPRIIELDDDPKSPVLKRRRIDDVDWSAKLTYQAVTDSQSPGSATLPCRPSRHDGYSNPERAARGSARSQPLPNDQKHSRRVELIPIVRTLQHNGNDCPTNGFVQNRDEGTIRVNQTSQRFRGIQSHYEPPVESPPRHANVHPQDEFSPRVHRLQQPMHHPYRLHASYSTEPMPGPGSAQSSPRTNHSVQNMSVSLRPLRPNEEGILMHADGRPAISHSYWVQNGSRAPDTEAQGYRYPPERYDNGNSRTLGRNLQHPEPLSPRGFRGRSSHPYNGGTGANVPQNLETTIRRKIDTDHEIVYITSSPPGRER